MHSFMCYYMEPIEKKAMKNWEWNSGVYIFIVLFHFFSQDYAIKAEIYLELLPFIFGGLK